MGLLKVASRRLISGMNHLLQDLQDLEDYKYCLSKGLYRTYKQYLIEKCLKEVDTGSIFEVFDYTVYKHKMSVDKRFDTLLRGFQQIKGYDQERDEKGNLTKKPTYMTHLQNNEGEPCTKEEFKKEICQYKFDEHDKALELIEKFLKMFDDEGWLIID